MNSLYRNSDKLFLHCINNSGKYVIKGNEILTYSQSPFAFYCNHFVADSCKDPLNEDIINLAKNGNAYEDRIVEDVRQSILRKLGITHEDQVTQEYRQSIPTNFKIMHVPTMREGFKMCLDKMINKKINILHNAPLLYLPAHILGKPDTLEKRTGKSIFGSHHYVVKEIKSARNITIHHKLQAAFYTLLIGRIQQRFPEKFYIIDGDGNENSYLYDDYESRLVRALIHMMNVLQHKEKPKPVYDHVQYPWSEYGNKLAIKQNGITLIIGIKEKTANVLKGYGFKTINSIASCDIKKLSTVPRIGMDKAKRFKTNAEAIKYNKIIKKTDPVIPNNKIEIFVDFEGESLPRNRIYLIGVLVREKRKKNRYISFFSKQIGERRMWREYIKFMKKQKNYAIYHWSHYEETHMVRMMTKHKTSREVIQTIFNNLFDLHPITTDSFAFPTYKNDLKSIANKINYYWDEPYLNGSNIGNLYYEYVRNHDSKKQYLQRIMNYNKNDCEAMMAIKDWLLKQ